MNNTLSRESAISEEFLVKILSEVMEIDPTKISPTIAFSEYGLDSLYGIQFVREIEDTIGREIDLRGLYDHPTIREFSKYLNTLMRAPVNASQVRA
ncbi:hypothetical protein GN109_15165 [Collimonas pratensis]|uniref:acyl carrier protein n=1 Tax=Collimonas pratensis TaxID=279113 RepID=UPI00143CEF23|nr:acyl carrier protein [Collimonas pratensis]NKI70762.1 hypothetical protein [Collimonas pratensis]